MSQRKNFFIPANLDINELNKVLTGERGTSTLLYKACLLYTLLSQDRIRLRQRGEDEGYTQIHRDTLVNIFDKQYRHVLDQLLDNDLLEVNQVDELTGEVHERGVYSKASGKAREYRLPAHLRTEKRLFKHAAMPTTNKVVRNTLDRLNQATTDPAVLSDYYRQTILKNSNRMILLDTPETRALIEQQCAGRGVTYSPELAEAVLAKFNESPIQMPKVCQFAGRIHAEFMRYKKEYRPYMRFEEFPDDELVEFDMVASQPWFLSIISPSLIKKFVPECADAIPFFKVVQNEPDYLLFRQKCQNATPGEGIYDYLAERWNKTYGDTFTRNDAKRICYRAFFSDYDKKEQTSIAQRERSVLRHQKLVAAAQLDTDMLLVMSSKQEQNAALAALEAAKIKLRKAESKLLTQKCYELFRAEFPATQRLFWNIKGLNWDFPRGDSDKVKYYANNALLAQRLEANIVFGVVVKALLEANITYVVTIHDAFVVRQKDALRARKIIQQAFKSIGLKPNLK